MLARPCLAVLALSAAPLAQGQVWVVDDDGGPGVDFTILQQGIDAAADGDVVLVKDGSYLYAWLDDRALTVCAEAGAVVRVARVLVSNLGPGRTARIQGLRSEGESTSPCWIDDCSGLVWIEDCVFESGQQDSMSVQDSITIVSSSSVVLVDVTARGFDAVSGFFWWMLPPPPPPQSGLELSASKVTAFGLEATGGDGASYSSFTSSQAYNEPGAPGIRVCDDSELDLVGGSAIGGEGGPTTTTEFVDCVTADGGAGIHGCFGLQSIVRARGATIQGGLGGSPSPLSFCGGSFGADGPPYSGSVFVETLEGSPSTLSATSPVREQASLDLALHGPPQAPVFLGISAQPDDLFVPALGAPIALAQPIFALALGVIPPSGTLALSLPILELPPGFESMVFHGQVAYVDAVGAVVVGAPASVVLLDAAL